ncbi:hypothetical protein BOO25_16315 [Vibrio navarrensis]|uniref:hypothetical protein n=1 Tax=Vibrio navarrensis TaxID=29495 RepID=UPI00192F70A3|nr:hypothetical protein [Vibrio navarrensis]MBE3670491.1 hypothetical protein [Vibrio navarrensis]
MRVSPSRRRRWNNILIAGITFFIVIINAPALIKTYLLDDPVAQSQYPSLLNPNETLVAFYLSDWALERQGDDWQSNQTLSVEAAALVNRWRDLKGTRLDDATVDKLSAQLRSPETIEVWYQDQEEPQRITFYRLSDFWLFKNWQDQWIAISVSPEYLMPQ